MDRTDWPDSRLDRMEARINGIPERVATITAELRELRSDVAAIRSVAERSDAARDSSKTFRTVAFIGAFGAIAASLVSSLALLVTQL